MKRVRASLVLLVALFALAPAAVAQRGQTPPAVAGADTAKPPNPAEVQAVMDVIDGWVLVQAQTALRLTDAQFPTVVRGLRALQNGRRRLQRQRTQLLMEIAKLTNPTVASVDETLVREKLKALDDLESAAFAEQRKALQDLDQALTVRQQARLRVLLDNVERRMFEALQKARNAGRGRGDRQQR